MPRRRTYSLRTIQQKLTAGTITPAERQWYRQTYPAAFNRHTSNIQQRQGTQAATTATQPTAGGAAPTGDDAIRNDIRQLQQRLQNFGTRDWVANPPRSKSEYEQRIAEGKQRQALSRQIQAKQQTLGARGLEQASEQANQANIQRYEDILGQYQPLTQVARDALPTLPGYFQGLGQEYQQRTQDLASLLQGFGDVQREDLERDRERREAAATQSLINRGLTPTTVYGSAMRGVESDYQKSRRDLQDYLTRQQMDYLKQLTGEELGARTGLPSEMLGAAGQAFAMGERPLLFQERREDVGPSLQDVSQYAQYTGTGLAGKPDYAGGLLKSDPSDIGTLGKIKGIFG